MQTSERRENMSDSQLAQFREDNRLRESQRRSNMSDAERESERQAQVERMRLIREDMRNKMSSVLARTGEVPTPYSLGKRDNLCVYGCGALLFDEEVIKGVCCYKGKVVLEDSQRLCPYPEGLKDLLLNIHPQSNDFFQYIRRYNSAFAFASFGSQAALPPGRGPYCFRIHGQIYHRLGSLKPASDVHKSYAQIYVLEGDGALQIRLDNNSTCNRNVMFTIQRTLDTCGNPFVQAYRNLHAIEQESRLLVDNGIVAQPR